MSGPGVSVKNIQYLGTGYSDSVGSGCFGYKYPVLRPEYFGHRYFRYEYSGTGVSEVHKIGFKCM